MCIDSLTSVMLTDSRDGLNSCYIYVIYHSYVYNSLTGVRFKGVEIYMYINAVCS